MKRSMSTFNIVSIHVTHSGIIFPFFGLLANYFFVNYLDFTSNPTLLLLVKDVILIASIYLGTSYSLRYIDKNIHVKNKKLVFIYSVSVFIVFIMGALLVSTVQLTNANAIIYNILFYVTVFAIFYIKTKKQFLDKFIFFSD